MCVIVVNELQTPGSLMRRPSAKPAVKSSNESIHLQTAFEEVTGRRHPRMKTPFAQNRSQVERAGSVHDQTQASI